MPRGKYTYYHLFCLPTVVSFAHCYLCCANSTHCWLVGVGANSGGVPTRKARNSLWQICRSQFWGESLPCSLAVASLVPETQPCSLCCSFSTSASAYASASISTSPYASVLCVLFHFLCLTCRLLYLFASLPAACWNPSYHCSLPCVSLLRTRLALRISWQVPHRDYTFSQTFRADGSPTALTVWVPVTEVLHPLHHIESV